MLKTESQYPGITTARMTGLANAAENLIYAVSGEGADCDEEMLSQIDAAKTALRRAIAVARGADLPLPRHLFCDTADKAAVRFVESVIGLE
jgi:hypothetical protein